MGGKGCYRNIKKGRLFLLKVKRLIWNEDIFKILMKFIKFIHSHVVDLCVMLCWLNTHRRASLKTRIDIIYFRKLELGGCYKLKYGLA